MTRYVFIAFFVGILLAGGFSLFAFSEPTQNPPAGNVVPPINEGELGQIKSGGLQINGNFVGLGGTGSPQLVVSGSNVGIGTLTPGAKLEVAGQIKITGGTPAAGKILTSDAAGLATWQTPAAGGIGGGGTINRIPKFTPTGTALGDSQITDNGANVGIGASTPLDRLHVAGTLRIEDPNFAILRLYNSGAAADSRLWQFFADTSGNFFGNTPTDANNDSRVWLKVKRSGININAITLGESGGNVGIGTANPGAPLDVASAVSGLTVLKLTNEYPTMHFDSTRASPGPLGYDYWLRNGDGNFYILHDANNDGAWDAISGFVSGPNLFMTGVIQGNEVRNPVYAP